jgi:hypothetical protein
MRNIAGELGSATGFLENFGVAERLVTVTYGVRRHSGAATALSFILPRRPASKGLQSGVALRLPPHSIGPHERVFVAVAKCPPLATESDSGVAAGKKSAGSL